MSAAARNHAEFPEFAAIVQRLRDQGATVKVLWLAKDGLTVGPAPADALDIFDTLPALEAAPRAGYRGTRGRT